MNKLIYNWKFEVGEQVHSELYRANGTVSSRRWIEDMSGGEEQYHVYFRTGNGVVTDHVEADMLEHGEKVYID